MTSQSLRRVGVPLAVAVAVLAIVLGGIRLVDPPGEGVGGSVVGPTAAPDEPMSRFSSVTAGSDGASVDVRFWGGVEDCYRYAVVARETDATVTLRLREESTFAGACIDLAQEYERSVRLDDALGARPVLDAVTGESLLAPSP